MTNTEAIFKLIEYRRQLERDFEGFDAEPFDIAIKVLEEKEAKEQYEKWEAIEEEEARGYFERKRQTCEDYISREEAKRLLANRRDELMMLSSEDNPKADATAHGVNWSLNTLMELPSVTPSYNSIKPELNLFEDCISRESLKQKLQEHHDFFVNAYGSFKYMPLKDKARVDEISNCIAEVVNAPSVISQPNTGHWIEKDGFGGDTYYDCSECGESWTTIDGIPWDNGMKYCPNCGAKMEVEE